MATTVGGQTLLSDETWSRLPPTKADRRVVGGALAAMALALTAVILGSTTGVLVPHLAYEGGSTTPDPQTHTVAITADLTNNSPRAWKITGATVDAAGTAHTVAMPAVVIPAHTRRTVRGVVQVNDCAAARTAPGVPGYGRSDDMHFRVQRLFGDTTFTVRDPLDREMVAMACAPSAGAVP